MLKKFLIGGVLVLLVVLGAELRSLWIEKENMSGQYDVAKKQFETSQKERGRLEADLNYLFLPENMDKELRARFHLQLPNEKVIILNIFFIFAR